MQGRDSQDVEDLVVAVNLGRFAGAGDGGQRLPEDVGGHVFLGEPQQGERARVRRQGFAGVVRHDLDDDAGFGGGVQLSPADSRSGAGGDQLAGVFEGIRPPQVQPDDAGRDQAEGRRKLQLSLAGYDAEVSLSSA